MIGMCVSWLFPFKKTKMNIAFARPFVQLKMAFTHSQKDVGLAFLDNERRDEKSRAKIFAIVWRKNWVEKSCMRCQTTECFKIKSKISALEIGGRFCGYNWIKTDYYAIFRMLITFLSFFFFYLNPNMFLWLSVSACDYVRLSASIGPLNWMRYSK